MKRWLQRNWELIVGVGLVTFSLVGLVYWIDVNFSNGDVRMKTVVFVALVALIVWIGLEGTAGQMK